VRPTAAGTSCQVCGGSCLPLFSTVDVNRRVTREVFHYRRCGACGVVVLENRPSNLRAYYGNGYFAEPRSVAELERFGRREQPKLDIVQTFVEGGRLLEVGPGMGSFAWLATRAGFAVDVIEQDERACRFLEDVVGVAVTRTSHPELVLAASRERYDVVTLWHVIEHLEDPWDTLTQSLRALRDDGILIVATPNPEAWQFQRLGARWPHVDAPRHLWLIPLDALRRHVEHAGAPLAWATTDDPEGKAWNCFGWSQWLRNLAPTGLGNALAVRLASRVAGAAVAQALRPWESADMNGSAYTAAFRKTSPDALAGSRA